MKLLLGPNRTLVQKVAVVHSQRVKRLRCEASHSPSSGDKVGNAWSYTSTPPYTVCSLSVPKLLGDITFLLGVLEMY